MELTSDQIRSYNYIIKKINNIKSELKNIIYETSEMEDFMTASSLSVIGAQLENYKQIYISAIQNGTKISGNGPNITGIGNAFGG